MTAPPTRSIAAPLAIALAAIVLAAALAVAVPALAWAFPSTLAWALGATLVAAGLIVLVALMRTRALERALARAQWSERELRASEAKFAGILDIADDAIITVDEQQAIIHFNKGAEKMFGWRAEEVVGRSLDTLIPGRFRRHHAGQVQAFGRSGETARRMGERREIFGLRRNGEEFPAEASISNLETPTGRLYTVVMRDVTERKRSDEAQRLLATVGERLARSIEYDATIAAVSNAAIPEFADACLLDVIEADGSIRRHSSDPGTVDGGAALASIVTRGRLDPDSPSRVIDVLRSGRSEVVHEVTADWIEGHTDAPAAWSALGVRSAIIVPLAVRGRRIGALTFLVTSPGRRRYSAADLPVADEMAHRVALALENARLYEAARNATRARDEVLGVVSHDLRNPLSAIGMFARGLRAPDADTASVHDLADSITNATQWMQRLIQDLLDVSAIEAGRLSIERRRESVGGIVARALTIVGPDASSRGLTVRTEVADSLPAVDVDAERIVQVLVNLIGNAIKFTESGGRIVIRATPDRHAVVVSVEDSGSGIPAAELPNVFTRYWHVRRRSALRGSGLGLAIARGIVDAHGGRIWAESTVGSGSTFSFSLPLAGAPATVPVPA